MTVQISYKNTKTKNNTNNIVLFVDEKFNISNLKKYISGKEYSIISDLLKAKDIKKKIIPLIKLNGIIGNVGKFKQGIDFSGQEEIITKAFNLKKSPRKKE